MKITPTSSNFLSPPSEVKMSRRPVRKSPYFPQNYSSMCLKFSNEFPLVCFAFELSFYTFLWKVSIETRKLFETFQSRLRSLSTPPTNYFKLRHLIYSTNLFFNLSRRKIKFSNKHFYVWIFYVFFPNRPITKPTEWRRSPNPLMSTPKPKYAMKIQTLCFSTKPIKIPT